MKKEPPSPSLHTPIPQRYCCRITRATAGRRERVLRQVVLWTTVSQSQTAPGAAQNLHGFTHRQLLPAKPSEEPSAPHSPVPGAVGALHRGPWVHTSVPSMLPFLASNTPSWVNSPHQSCNSS